MAVKNLEVQLGRETTWATAVTPTVRLMLVDDCDFDSMAKAKVFRQMHRIGPGNIAVTMSRGAEGSVKAVGSYDDIPYWLEAGFGIVTPTGAGPYVRAGSAPLTAASVNPRIHTMVIGDVDATYRLRGMELNELEFGAKAGEDDVQLDIDSQWVGQQKDTTTLAGLSDRTVTPITANDFALYIDTWGGTIGTTAVATTALEFRFKFNFNRILRRYLGSPIPGAIFQGRMEPDDAALTLTVDVNATSVAIYNAVIAGTLTQRQIRLTATNGTNIAQFNFAGTVVEAPKYGEEEDDIKTLEFEFVGTEHSGLANFFTYSITNGVAVLA